MENFDEFSNNLLEESKRFFEKAIKEEDQHGKTAYLHSSLLLSISSLEAFVNGIADDFKDASCFNLHERAFLIEKEISLINGEFKIENRLKMSRLLERIEFLFNKFDSSKLNKNSNWWRKLKEGISLRNSLVHPKTYTPIREVQIESTLRAVIDCVNNLFFAIYKKGLPTGNMGLDSKLTF